MTTIAKRWSLAGLAAVLVVAAAVAGCTRDKGEKTDGTDAKAVGAAALEEGNWSKAYDSYTAALEANPDDAEAYYSRAVALCAQAEEHYQLAQAAATNKDVDKGMTEAAKADDFFAKTVADCDAAIAAKKDYADPWFLKGVVAQYQGAWNDGIDAFSECVKIDPARGEAYHRRGEIYDNIGDYMNAATDFKKATELGFVREETAESDPDGEDDDFSELNYDPDAEDAGSDAE